VALPDWEGKPLLVGQGRGFENPFIGKFHAMTWNGKELKEGPSLPANPNILPLSGGILGLSSGRFGSEGRFLYTDEMERLRVLDAGGKSIYKSKGTFGSAGDYFEWGPVSRLEGNRAQYTVRDAPRVLTVPEGKPFVLIPEVKKGVVSRTLGSFDTSRLVLIQWDNGELVERAATPKSDHYYSGADVLSPSNFRKGGLLVATVIEQEPSLLKNPVSRIQLLSVE